MIKLVEVDMEKFITTKTWLLMLSIMLRTMLKNIKIDTTTTKKSKD